MAFYDHRIGAEFQYRKRQASRAAPSKPLKRTERPKRSGFRHRNTFAKRPSGHDMILSSKTGRPPQETPSEMEPALTKTGLHVIKGG